MSLNSPFAIIFEAVLARIQALVPAIKHIDQDMGQIEGNSSRPAVAFPVILIDFQGWQFEALGRLTQRGEGDVVIKLGFAQFTPSSDKVDGAYREQALAFYDIEWNINKALHMWSPGDNFGYLTRSSAASSNIAAGIRVRTITYRLALEDYSTLESGTIMHPDGSVTGQLLDLPD